MTGRKPTPPPLPGAASRAKAVTRPLRAGPPREREELSETKQRILDAALSLFAERGFDGATTAAIAVRAGVAEKTLFANFGSKQRLYDASLSRGPESVVTLMPPEAVRTLEPVFADAPGDLRAFLRTLIENRLAFARSHPREIKLMVQHVMRNPEALRDLEPLFRAQAEPRLRRVLQGMIARGDLRGDVALGAVERIMVTAVVGYALMSTILRPDIPWDERREVDQLVTVLVDGLAARHAKSRAPRRR